MVINSLYVIIFNIRNNGFKGTRSQKTLKHGNKYEF